MIRETRGMFHSWKRGYRSTTDSGKSVEKSFYPFRPFVKVLIFLAPLTENDRMRRLSMLSSALDVRTIILQ